MIEQESMIVDASGKPLKRVLTEEYARPSVFGVRQAWLADSAANGLTPTRLAAILQGANEGNDYDLLTLAEEMEERSEYGGLLGVRKRAVLAMPQKVVPASDDAKHKQHADEVGKLVLRPEFRQLRADLLDALGKGRSTVELIWQTKKTPHTFSQYIWRDPRYFRYNPADPQELRLIDGSDVYHGLPLPSFKFITHRPRIKTGLPVRDGLARMVAVYYMLTSYGLKDWTAFNELFGLPIRVGRYGANAKQDDINILRTAVANIGSDAAALIPDSMRIEFIERANSSGTDVFERLADWLGRKITIAVLGQTASTQGTPGKLGGDFAQMQVADDIRDADATELDATINAQMVKAYIDWNYGEQDEYPRVESVAEEPEDLKVLVDALGTLLPQGLRVKQSEIRSKLRLSEPEAGDEVFASTPPPPAVFPNASLAAHGHNPATCPSCVALNRAGAGADTIDHMVMDALIDWQPVMQPIIDPIQVLADECQDEAEFLARLPELLQTMDANALIRSLATETFKARGLGDTDA